MSGQHTQGQIGATHWSDSAWDLRNATGGNVASFIRKQDARRLAACWNAFDGVSTEDIEMWAEHGTSGVKAVIAKNDQLRADQRAIEANYEAARELLTDALASDDEAIADAEVVGLSFPAELTALTERIRAFLKGQP